MQYFIGSSGTAESFVTVEPLYYELSRDWKNMFAMKKFGNIQVITIYRRTSIQGTPSGPGKVFPEWRLNLGLLIVNLRIKCIFLLSGLQICCGQYFKQLNNA